MLAQTLLERWDQITGTLEEYVGLAPETIDRVLIILFVLLLYLLLRFLIYRSATRRIDDLATRLLVIKVATFTLALIVLFVIFRVWLGRFSGVLGYLSVLSAGLAIALRQPITDLAAWFYIITRRPFSIGDRIQIGEHAGDVANIRYFTFTLVEIREWVNADQSTGRIIHVPNGWVFDKAVSNYVQGFNYIWNEMAVTVTAESNWEKAKAILTEIADRYAPVQGEEVELNLERGAERYLIHQPNLTPSVWTSLAENGTKITLRYLTGPRDRRAVTSEITEAILRAFAEQDDIEMAYPTYRVTPGTAREEP